MARVGGFSGAGSSGQMVGLDVIVPKGEIDRLRVSLQALGLNFNRIVSRSINKTSTWTRQRIVEMVRKLRPGVKVSVIRHVMKLVRASVGRLQADLGIGGGRVPVFKMSPSPKTPEADRARTRGRGVSYRQATGGRVRIREAFIARMPSGHVGVFKRVAGTKMAAKNKESIVETWGPSVPQVILDAVSEVSSVMERTSGRLWMEIWRQVELALAKGGFR